MMVDLDEDQPAFRDYLEPCPICGRTSMRVKFLIDGVLDHTSGGYAHVLEIGSDILVAEGCLLQRGGVG